MRGLIFACVLLFSVPLAAQAPVQPVPDWASYFTASVNPTIAVIQAVRSEQPKCQLARLALTEAIGNGVALTVKHFIVSPRPCLGCASDGMPSGHTLNSTIGFSSRDWRVGLWFTLGTAELRTVAHRHTPAQVAVGAALGLFSEWAGTRLLKCS